MGLSLSVDSPAGRADPDNQKQITYFFSDQTSLLFVFVRAFRWCLVAVVLHLAFAQLWYDPAARYRSSWLSTYPFQIYGVCLALLLAVRLWASLQRSWQFGLQLQALGNKLSEYAALGLALEGHSRDHGCGKCHKPFSTQEWVDQQNYRLAFLHYVSLLHAMAMTTLCSAGKPQFKEHPNDVLQGRKAPQSSEKCNCPETPRSERERALSQHFARISPRPFQTGPPEIIHAGPAPMMDAAQQTSAKNSPVHSAAGSQSPGRATFASTAPASTPQQHTAPTKLLQGPGADASAATSHYSTPTHNLGPVQGPQEAVSPSRAPPLQQGTNVAHSSAVYTPTTAADTVPHTGATQSTVAQAYTIPDAPTHVPHASTPSQGTHQSPPTPPPSLGANSSVTNVADDSSTQSKPAPTEQKTEIKSILKKSKAVLDEPPKEDTPAHDAGYSKDDSTAPSGNNAGPATHQPTPPVPPQNTGSPGAHTAAAASTESPHYDDPGLSSSSDQNGAQSEPLIDQEYVDPLSAEVPVDAQINGEIYVEHYPHDDPNYRLEEIEPVSDAEIYMDQWGQYVDQYGQVYDPAYVERIDHFADQYVQQWTPGPEPTYIVVDNNQCYPEHPQWPQEDPAVDNEPGYEEDLNTAEQPVAPAQQPFDYQMSSTAAPSPDGTPVQKSMLNASYFESDPYKEWVEGPACHQVPQHASSNSNYGPAAPANNPFDAYPTDQPLEELPSQYAHSQAPAAFSNNPFDAFPNEMNQFVEEDGYGAHTVPQQFSQHVPQQVQGTFAHSGPHYEQHPQYGHHSGGYGYGYAMNEGVQQGLASDSFPSTNLEVPSKCGKDSTDALEPQESGMITLRGGMGAVHDAIGDAVADAVAADLMDQDIVMDPYAEVSRKGVEEAENRVQYRALAQGLQFDSRPMRRRNPPAPNPFLKLVGGIMGIDTRPRAKGRYRYQQKATGHKKVGVRLNKAVAESQSASGSEKAADEALVWHENPMASQLSSSSPIEISIESTDSQDQQEQSTDTAVVAMPMIEGKITGKSTKDIVESTRRRKGRSGSDDYSDVVVEQKALELSLWTLSAYSGSEQQRPAIFTVILGLSTSEREYLGLPVDANEKPSMSNTERFRSVQKWLQDHLLGGMSGFDSPRGSSIMMPSMCEKKDHLHSLLTDALDAYTTCKATASSSITSAWLLSSAALLALFSVVLPVVSASRINNTLISAAVTGVLVLGFAVMFELATYLDAFVLLVPSGAESTQVALNDRLVTSARGSVPSSKGGPKPHRLMRKKGQMNARIQSYDNTMQASMHSIHQSRNRLTLTKENRLFVMSPGGAGTAGGGGVRSTTPHSRVSPRPSDSARRSSQGGTSTQQQQRERERDRAAVNNPLYSHSDDGAAQPHHNHHQRQQGHPSMASSTATIPYHKSAGGTSAAPQGTAGTKPRSGKQGESCCSEGSIARQAAPEVKKSHPRVHSRSEPALDHHAQQHTAAAAAAAAAAHHSATSPQLHVSRSPQNEDTSPHSATATTPERALRLQASSNSRPPLQHQNASTPFPGDAPVLHPATEDNVRSSRARAREPRDTRPSSGSESPSSPSWSSDSSPERDGFFSKPSLDSSKAVPYVHSPANPPDGPSTQVQSAPRPGELPIDLVAPTHAEARPPAHMQSIPPPQVLHSQVGPIPQTSGHLELTVQDSEKLPAVHKDGPPAPAPKAVANVNAAALRGEKLVAADLQQTSTHFPHHHQVSTDLRTYPGQVPDYGPVEEPPKRLREKYGTGPSKEKKKSSKSAKRSDRAAHATQKQSDNAPKHNASGAFAATSTGALPDAPTHLASKAYQGSPGSRVHTTAHTSTAATMPKTAPSPSQGHANASVSVLQHTIMPASPKPVGSAPVNHGHTKAAANSAQQAPSGHPAASNTAATGPIGGPVLPAVNTKPPHGYRTQIVSTKSGPVKKRVPVDAKHAPTAAQKSVNRGQEPPLGSQEPARSRSSSPSPNTPSNAPDVQAKVSPNSAASKLQNTPNLPAQSPLKTQTNAADIHARSKAAATPASAVKDSSATTHTNPKSTSDQVREQQRSTSRTQGPPRNSPTTPGGPSTAASAATPTPAKLNSEAPAAAHAYDARAPPAQPPAQQHGKTSPEKPLKPQSTPLSTNSTNYQHYKMQQVPVPAVWMPESAQTAPVAHYVHWTPHGGSYVTHHAVPPHSSPLAAPHTASHGTPHAYAAPCKTGYPAPQPNGPHAGPHAVPHGAQYALHGGPYMTAYAPPYSGKRSPKVACDDCRAWPNKPPTPTPPKGHHGHNNGMTINQPSEGHNAAPKGQNAAGVRTKIIATKSGPVRVVIKSPRTANKADDLDITSGDLPLNSFQAQTSSSRNVYE